MYFTSLESSPSAPASDRMIVLKEKLCDVVVVLSGNRNNLLLRLIPFDFVLIPPPELIVQS